MIGSRDIVLKEDGIKELLLDKHEHYLKQYAHDEKDPDQIMNEHLKMSAMYWGLNALYIMNTLEKDKSSEINLALDFIKKCQTEDGGFRAAPRHDSHLLHTLSAVQMLVILNECNENNINIGKCVNYVKSLQQPDGSFAGDKWGERDTRFSCCALAILKLLDRLDSIDLNKAVEFVISCYNDIDGGFGRLPGSESHAAYVYCCVSSISIANRLDLVDVDALARWISERQLPSGGFNGRPEKLPDVCYSWWCLASLKILNRMNAVDHKRLLRFILACQDDEQGGFSDRPGNCVDPFHTNFGLASISLICHGNSSDTDEKEVPQGSGNEQDSKAKDLDTIVISLRNKLKPVEPTMCLPE